MSRHSHRRSRQSPAMVSPSSLLVTVLLPPCPGRLFLVWRVPPHCCSLPPQGLVAALTRAAFFWLSRLACRSQRCPLTSQGFRRLVGDRLRRAEPSSYNECSASAETHADPLNGCFHPTETTKPLHGGGFEERGRRVISRRGGRSGPRRRGRASRRGPRTW